MNRWVIVVHYCVGVPGDQPWYQSAHMHIPVPERLERRVSQTRIVYDGEACNNAGLRGIDQQSCRKVKTAQLFEILVRSIFYSLELLVSKRNLL
jgi:hypothetical protein